MKIYFNHVSYNEEMYNVILNYLTKLIYVDNNEI